MKVIPFLLFRAGVGAFIYGFVPQKFITKYAGPDNVFAVPSATIIGVPMYVRTETMIPIAKALNASGMSIGAIMAFAISVFLVTTITGVAFNFMFN